MNFYYLGYKTTVRPDFEQYLAEPKAPKNYKNQEAITEYLDKARTEAASSAASKPFTSIVQEVTVFSTNCRDSVVEEVARFSGATAAHDLAKLLEDISEKDSQVYAFNINNFIRSLCTQVIKEGFNFNWMYLYLYKSPAFKDMFIDPTRLFLPSVEEQGRISVINLFKYFGLSLTESDLIDTAIQAKKLHEFAVATKIECSLISNNWHA